MNVLVGQADATDVNGLNIPESGEHTHSWTIRWRDLSGGGYGAYTRDTGSNRDTFTVHEGKHTHTIESTDNETRPVNLTYNLWKRIN